MKLFIKIIIILIPILIGAVYYALNYVAPFGIILMVRFSPEQALKVLGEDTTPGKYGLKYEKLTVTVQDTINLKGYFIPNSKGYSNKTVLVLHGINGCKEQQLKTAAFLAQNGFNVYAFDSRGHGESGGKYCTYGFYEKYDFSNIIDYILAKDSSQQIGIYGHSMGGAIALQTMAIDKRIKCGVIESTFSTLREIVSDYMKRMFFFGPMFISNIALDKAGKIADFDPEDVKPEEYCKKITQPIFMAHGDKDKHINIDYGKRNFNNLKSPIKVWRTVPGAEHMNVHKTGGEEYKLEFLEFFKNYLN